MRYYFNQQLCKYSIKKEEIDVSELPAWDTRIVGSIIDKIGVITGHLKTEQFDQAYVAYFDCKFHKKSKYMLEISEYDIWNTYRIKNIDVMISTKKNGEKCECFKRDDWETSFRRIFADYIQSSSDDNDCGDDEMDENDKEHDEQVSQEVTKQDEPSVDENSSIEIPNYDRLKELVTLFNEKRKQRNEEEYKFRLKDPLKIKEYEEEIQQLADQIINF